MLETEGDRIELTCSNCNAGLVQVVVTNPNPELTVRARANCPWCGDSSFTKEIPGAFARDGFATQKCGLEDDPDGYDESTVVADDEFVDPDIIVFHVVKARTDAKPVYVG